jgi:hypothetical protein
MNTWLIIVTILIVVTGVLLSPALFAIWKAVRSVNYAQTAEARLQMANLWTEIQQVKDNYVLVSIGVDTMKVFLSPKLDEIENFSELASVNLLRSCDRKRAEVVFSQARQVIGWPDSVVELRKQLTNLPWLI